MLAKYRGKKNLKRLFSKLIALHFLKTTALVHFITAQMEESKQKRFKRKSLRVTTFNLLQKIKDTTIVKNF